MMFAQFKQDYYLYKFHFSKLRRRGNYLDVAANEAMEISNTFFFDRCLGWHGLCIEPNAHYLEALHRQRSCALLPTCVGDNDGEKVEFALFEGISGIVTTNKATERWRREGRSIKTVPLRCTTLAKALARYPQTTIDYMSLDVEGHEVHVLRGIDWTSVKINIITVEISNNLYEKIKEFLGSKGYTQLIHFPDGTSALMGEDIIFVASGVKFGEPE